MWFMFIPMRRHHLVMPTGMRCRAPSDANRHHLPLLLTLIQYQTFDTRGGGRINQGALGLSRRIDIKFRALLGHNILAATRVKQEIAVLRARKS